MDADYDLGDIFNFEFVDESGLHRSSQVQNTGTPFGADATSLPATVESNATPSEVSGETPRGSAFRGRPPSCREKLQFLQEAEWDPDKTYDEHPPTCLHYSIEWKVKVNDKVISKDTESDLVLAPAYYWEHSLHFRLDKLLQKIPKTEACSLTKPMWWSPSQSVHSETLPNDSTGPKLIGPLLRNSWSPGKNTSGRERN
jgi:hypothetical protein